MSGRTITAILGESSPWAAAQFPASTPTAVAALVVVFVPVLRSGQRGLGLVEHAHASRCRFNLEVEEGLGVDVLHDDRVNARLQQGVGVIEHLYLIEFPGGGAVHDDQFGALPIGLVLEVAVLLHVERVSSDKRRHPNHNRIPPAPPALQ